MNEAPDLNIIDLDPALRQLGNQAPQREVPRRPLQQVHTRQDPTRWPPICPGATLPVTRPRRTHLIAVLIATPKRAAAAWRDIPSRSTAATTRSRKSIE